MEPEPGLNEAAQLFKVLSNGSRLWLLRLISAQERTVGELAALTGLPQPLVSQHLRSLRLSGLVTAVRSGKEVTYGITDTHVTHVVEDAVAHVLEEPRRAGASCDGQGRSG